MKKKKTLFGITHQSPDGSGSISPNISLMEGGKFPSPLLLWSARSITKERTSEFLGKEHSILPLMHKGTGCWRNLLRHLPEESKMALHRGHCGRGGRRGEDAGGLNAHSRSHSVEPSPISLSHWSEKVLNLNWPLLLKDTHTHTTMLGGLALSGGPHAPLVPYCSPKFEPHTGCKHSPDGKPFFQELNFLSSTTQGGVYSTLPPTQLTKTPMASAQPNPMVPSVLTSDKDQTSSGQIYYLISGTPVSRILPGLPDLSLNTGI